MTDDAPDAKNDPELRAVHALIRYLDPLDQSACDRVLKWAEARYVMQHDSRLDPQWITNFMDALSNAAREMGDMRPIDILTAAEELRRIRSEKNEDEAA